MDKKHEYWMFKFEGQSSLYASGPVDMGKPVVEKEIIKYLQKRYETKETILAWPTTPWWENKQTITQDAWHMRSVLEED